MPGPRDSTRPGCVCHSEDSVPRGPVRPLPCRPRGSGRSRSLTHPSRPVTLHRLCLPPGGPQAPLRAPAYRTPSPTGNRTPEPPAESWAETEGSASWPLGLPLAPSTGPSAQLAGHALPCRTASRPHSPRPSQPAPARSGAAPSPEVLLCPAGLPPTGGGPASLQPPPGPLHPARPVDPLGGLLPLLPSSPSAASLNWQQHPRVCEGTHTLRASTPTVSTGASVWPAQSQVHPRH